MHHLAYPGAKGSACGQGKYNWQNNNKGRTYNWHDFHHRHHYQQSPARKPNTFFSRKHINYVTRITTGHCCKEWDINVRATELPFNVTCHSMAYNCCLFLDKKHVTHQGEFPCDAKEWTWLSYIHHVVQCRGCPGALYCSPGNKPSGPTLSRARQQA
eukprot:scaffold117144_cov33-Prasinocladus_malaysianus.AAC.1